MNEQGKRELIEEMAKERDRLLKEVGVTKFLTDLVRKKAEELIAHEKKECNLMGEGRKDLLKIGVYHKESLAYYDNPNAVYRADTDCGSWNLSEEMLEEMRTAISLIEDSGYSVQKIKPTTSLGKNFLEGYVINI